MKAVQISETGGPDVLKYVELPTPRPGTGEVLVKAHAIGVSMPEMLVRQGVYAWMPPLPLIPGIEMSGTVVETGSGCNRLRVGQKSICLRARVQGARQLLCRIHCRPGEPHIRGSRWR